MILVADRSNSYFHIIAFGGVEANILVNQYILLWGCPRTILSDTDCSSTLGFHKVYTSCWVCTSLLQAFIIPTVTGALSG